MKERRNDFAVFVGTETLQLVAATPTLLAAEAVRRLYAGECFVIHASRYGDAHCETYIHWPVSHGRGE